MRFALACAVVALSGCTLPTPAAFQLRTAPQIDSSQFEPVITIYGPEVAIPGAMAPLSKYMLRSWVDKATRSPSGNQLYVQHYYDGDWVFWQSANTENSQEIEFSSISRDVVSCSSSQYRGCTFREVFGVPITDAQLRTHPNGFAVKFYAKTGATMVLRITPEQIATQLQLTGAKPIVPSLPAIKLAPKDTVR